MTVSRKSTAQDSPDDDIPDMTEAYWAEKIASATVKRGRPKAAVTKVSQNLRLDRDVLEAYKSTGPGWQTRMNDVLKKSAPRVAKKPRKRA